MNGLTAGAARVEITPPLSVPYLGYVPRHAFFEGVHDPLFARTVVVGDGERRIALVAADSIGFARGLLGPGRDFAGEFRERAHRLTGIPPEAIIVHLTHFPRSDGSLRCFHDGGGVDGSTEEAAS